MEGEFSGGWQERGGLGEEVVVLGLHGDGFDEHGVAGVLVGLELYLEKRTHSHDK